MKNIIHKQYNHIGKRNKWALKYARKIAEALEITGALKIARITAIISEAGESYPPECIKDDVIFSSPRFDEYYSIDKEIFTDIIKDLEESGRGHYDQAEDFIVIHRPNAEKTALEVAKEIAPKKSGSFYNDLIYNCFRYQDKNGDIKQFNRGKLSNIRNDQKIPE